LWAFNITITLDVVGEYTPLNDKHTVKYKTGHCPLCGKPIIHDMEKNSALPAAREFENIKHLPQDIETLYNKMRDAFSVKAYTCCVIAGRINVAVEQGVDANKSFVNYVNFLVDNCLPKSKSKPWVDKVRELGNASVHKLVIATKENAEISLTFLTAILKNIYEFPNSV